jgi:hypothetical protein
VACDGDQRFPSPAAIISEAKARRAAVNQAGIEVASSFIPVLAKAARGIFVAQLDFTCLNRNGHAQYIRCGALERAP